MNLASIIEVDSIKLTFNLTEDSTEFKSSLDKHSSKLEFDLEMNTKRFYHNPKISVDHPNVLRYIKSRHLPDMEMFMGEILEVSLVRKLQKQFYPVKACFAIIIMEIYEDKTLHELDEEVLRQYIKRKLCEYLDHTGKDQVRILIENFKEDFEEIGDLILDCVDYLLDRDQKSKGIFEMIKSIARKMFHSKSDLKKPLLSK